MYEDVWQHSGVQRMQQLDSSHRLILAVWCSGERLLASLGRLLAGHGTGGAAAPVCNTTWHHCVWVRAVAKNDGAALEELRLQLLLLLEILNFDQHFWYVLKILEWCWQFFHTKICLITSLIWFPDVFWFVVDWLATRPWPGPRPMESTKGVPERSTDFFLVYMGVWFWYSMVWDVKACRCCCLLLISIFVFV